MSNRLVRLLPLLVLVSAPVASQARDHGQYANIAPDIREWVQSLKDGEGVGCCATADGIPLEEPDWEMTADGYRVKLEGTWYKVPERAVITEPNKLGHAVVWFYWQTESVAGTTGSGGTLARTPYIRCFVPGSTM